MPANSYANVAKKHRTEIQFQVLQALAKELNLPVDSFEVYSATLKVMETITSPSLAKRVHWLTCKRHRDEAHEHYYQMVDSNTVLRDALTS